MYLGSSLDGSAKRGLLYRVLKKKEDELSTVEMICLGSELKRLRCKSKRVQRIEKKKKKKQKKEKEKEIKVQHRLDRFERQGQEERDG